MFLSKIKSNKNRICSLSKKDNLRRRAKSSRLLVLALFVLFGIFEFSASFSCKNRKEAIPAGPKESLTIVSYGGGAYQESHKTAFCEPFSLYTGISVESVVWNADYGRLKAMVESGRVPWDVVEVTAAEFSRGKNENLYEKLSVKPTYGNFLEGAISEYGIANMYWGTVLCYRKETFPENPPKTWKDFFDTKKYPGARALYDDPRGNLEFALLADGVSPDQLYPLDVDRAFLKLNQIKPNVRVWWTDGTQPVQLLLTGSVDLSSAWNGRIFASQEARKKLEYSWNGAALELDYWVIPRGARHPDMASRFIAFASTPPALARQTELVGYGPANIEALKYVDKDILVQLPTYEPNWKTSFVVNSEWWKSNEEKVKVQWMAWKIK
jgi:putative spermidine/putrescine transport system substrate-binding protein